MQMKICGKTTTKDLIKSALSGKCLMKKKMVIGRKKMC